MLSHKNPNVDSEEGAMTMAFNIIKRNVPMCIKKNTMSIKKLRQFIIIQF
jgi:hypothetical protein